MTEQLASTTPTTRIAVSGSLKRLLVCLLPATTAMYCLYQGIQQVLIPAQVEAIDPANKVANLALLTSIAAVTSLLALPIGGAVSDRTRSRFGRRTPWLAAMAVLSALLVAFMGATSAVLVLALVYASLWFTSNFYQGALTAILPDRIPVEHRGLASSVIGLGTPLGILIGVNFAARVSPQIAYIGIGLFLIVTTLALIVVAPEGRSPDDGSEARVSEKRRFDIASIGSFFSAFTSRNFFLAFFSRILLFLSYFVVSGYLFYTLQDHIGTENLPGQNAAVAVATLSSVQTVTWIVVAAIAGVIADKLDRRKLFVAICSIGLGATMIIPIVSPTWVGMLTYSILSGAFFGTYMSVDLALMSLVLPNKESEGRDMGLLAVATGAPQLLSSAIAGALITFAGGYDALFIFGAAVAIISGLFVFPIRGIK